MVTQATLSSALASLLGPNAVLHGADAAPYAVGGLAPQAVALPRTAEEVAAVLHLAHREQLAVIPWGGGTLMHIGNVPRRYDIALSLSRLDRVLEHEPADLTATVEAGCTLAAFQQRLANGGQWLPLDPPRAEAATIGGVLAANASGPSRHAHGSARDLVIGMKVVTAEGRITKAGGKVVKNVAGYDLCKLYIGSLGTLGVVVEATFKLAPLPKAEASALVTFSEADAACRYAARLHRLGLNLRAMELLNSVAAEAVGLETRSPWALAISLEGSPAGVQRSRREAHALAPPASFIDTEHSDALQERLRGLASPAGGLLCKTSILPSQVSGLLAAVEAQWEPTRMLARPSLGLVYMAWPPSFDAPGALANLRFTVANLGGTLIVEGCPADLKAQIDVFGDPRSDFGLVRRIKAQFDPKDILNPGRFTGRL